MILGLPLAHREELTESSELAVSLSEIMGSSGDRLQGARSSPRTPAGAALTRRKDSDFTVPSADSREARPALPPCATDPPDASILRTNAPLPPLLCPVSPGRRSCRRARVR